MLIIKKTISICVALTLMLALLPSAAAAAPSPSAASAVVMTGDGQLLYDKNGQARALIASTTKLMTAIVVLENAELNELANMCC